MFQIYRDHHSSHMTLPMTSRPEMARELAEADAAIFRDSLYRVFEVLPSGDYQFVTAWSVLKGKVREHRAVTIPAAHW